MCMQIAANILQASEGGRGACPPPHPPFLRKLDIITITLILSFAFSINKEGKEL